MLGSIIELHCLTGRTRNKYQIKFLVPTCYEQFKYYLWKEKLKDIQLSFSIHKSLHYLEIELSKFKAENRIPTEYLIILSGITLAAFWRIFDDTNLIGKDKMIIDMVIFWVSYRYITFKFYLFPGKQKELLEFKQHLLRLKLESK